MNDGNLMLAASERQIPYNATTDVWTVTVLDTLGRVIKSSSLFAEGVSYFNRLIKLRDGNYLLGGTSSVESKIYRQVLVKVDENLNVIWKKVVPVLGNKGILTQNSINNILESSENDIFCSIKDNSSLSEEVRFLLKLNSNGDIVWCKKYDAGTNIFPGQLEYETPMVELGDFLYLKYSEEASQYTPNIIKIRKSDGQPEWSKKFSLSGNPNFIVRNMLAIDGNLFICGSNASRPAIISFSPQGQVLTSKTVSEDIRGGMAVDTSLNNLLIPVTYSYGASKISGIVEMDQHFSVKRKQFSSLPKSSTGKYSVVPYNDSISYVAESFLYDNPYWTSISFTKFNFNSSFGSCDESDFSISVNDMPVTVTDKVAVYVDSTKQQTSDLGIVSSSRAHVKYDKYYCGSTPSCDSVEVQGSVGICDSSLTYTYVGRRNPGCHSPVQWRLDTIQKQVKVISGTDTSITLKVLDNAKFTLHARLFGSCSWVFDSLTVVASLGSSQLDLGSDTVICDGNTVVLNAGGDFVSYRWQNGYAGPTLTVTEPGFYYVDVIDACGASYSDSIRIMPKAVSQISIGPDRSKCSGDTVQLRAPGGFLSYSWSPSYNITGAQSAVAIVSPDTDTFYILKVEMSPGCFAFDTVRIKVDYSLPLSLGGDTSLCHGQTVTLNAGPGFKSYQWSNGHNGQQLTIGAEGLYWVKATTEEGCISTDTFSIKQVHAVPVAVFNRASGICEGTTRVLDAGEFSSYRWHDGSSTRFFAAKDTGIFYVRITDIYGCSNIDSVHIAQRWKSPRSFLPADTSICNYGSSVLRSRDSYNSYRWNNGAINRDLNIEAPGMYSLKVTDRNGCVGIDSITVNIKQCLTGLFVPSAFTPNADGKNDHLRAMLFGDVRQFDFRLYNRFGQLVYQTADPLKGWDGRVAGKPQDAGAYVWVCTYTLNSQPQIIERGTSVLLR